MSCLTVTNISAEIVIVRYDGDQLITILPGLTHRDLYSNVSISSMLIELEQYKTDQKVEYTVHDFVALPRDPNNDDDKTKAIRIGERFFNTATGLNYYCTDNDEGSATWVNFMGIPI